MIAAISTTIADTMSQPNAIATPLISSRKSSLFPILRADSATHATLVSPLTLRLPGSRHARPILRVGGDGTRGLGISSFGYHMPSSPSLQVDGFNPPGAHST
jgi:hypothetical protein